MQAIPSRRTREAPIDFLMRSYLHAPCPLLLCKDHAADEGETGAQHNGGAGKENRREKVAPLVREQPAADWVASDRRARDEYKGDALSQAVKEAT